MIDAALATSPATTFQLPGTRLARGGRVFDPLTLGIASLAFYLASSLSNYQLYLSHGFDLGIFDQAVRGYAHFRPPFVPIKGPNFLQLGDHFSPILAVFAPLYWIWDDARMLLIGQAILVALSVLVVHRIASRRLVRGAAAFATAIYAFGWPIQSLVNFDVHEVAFALPLLALALDALDRGRWRTAAAWAAALLLVKEDLSLVLVVFGLVLFIRARRHNPRLARFLGALVAATGIAAFALLTKIVIPAIAHSHGYVYWEYPALGSGPAQAVRTLLTDPWHVIATLFSPAIKTATILMLVVPLGGLCILSNYALIALPMIAELMLGAVEAHWLPTLHYDALPWLCLCVAAIDTLHRRRIRSPRLRHAAAVTLVTLSLATQVVCMQAIAGFVRVDPGRSVLARFVAPINPSPQERHGAVQSMPPGVCVEASNSVLAYLTRKDYATVLLARDVHPDYLIVDLTYPDVRGDTQGPPGTIGPTGPTPREVLTAATSAGYRAIAHFGKLEVLRAPADWLPSAECGPLAAGKRGSLTKIA